MSAWLEAKYKELGDTKPRYDRAVAALEAQDIAFTDLVDECCRSCALSGDAIKEGSTGAYAWTFIGQDPKLIWVDGVLREFEEYYDEDEDDLDDGFEDDEEQDETTSEDIDKSDTLLGAAPDLYVYYGTTGEEEESLEIAKKVAEAFKAEGFEVKWDGTTNDSICLILAPDFRRNY